MSFRQEPNKYDRFVFIVSCPKCKAFESLQVSIYPGNVVRVEETSHYYLKGKDIIHSPCNRVCTFTGKRFLAGLAKVSRGML